MLLIGVEYLKTLVEQGEFSAKMVFNENGAIIFPVSQQHRDQKAAGISYEDDYRGDALAAMLAPGKVEVRFHKSFSDRGVAVVLRSLLAAPELSFMRDWRFTYQGRNVTVT